MGARRRLSSSGQGTIRAVPAVYNGMETSSRVKRSLLNMSGVTAISAFYGNDIVNRIIKLQILIYIVYVIQDEMCCRLSWTQPN